MMAQIQEGLFGQSGLTMSIGKIGFIMIQKKEAAFCFTCIKAIEKNLVSSNNMERAFISTRFKNWSDAATTGRGFEKHSKSDAHREAYQQLHAIPQSCEDIGEQISQIHANEKSVNRQALLLSLIHI